MYFQPNFSRDNFCIWCIMVINVNKSDRIVGGDTDMNKRHYILLMIILCALFVTGRYYIVDSMYIEIITTSLAIIAAVSFFMELKSNERINEAQLIMELNNQFITNPQFTDVELELEKYFNAYRKAGSPTCRENGISLGIDLDVFDKRRQDLVNYLVHLEGVAALVDEGVLHLNVITDLMAYRYFIAVNNPIVQEKELLPYRDYYRGIIRIYDKWSEALGEKKVPMAAYSLARRMEKEK